MSAAATAFPESIGDEGGDQRESGKPQRAEPAVDPGQDERGSGELGDDRSRRQWLSGKAARSVALGYRTLKSRSLSRPP